jgi:hypothetical protein
MEARPRKDVHDFGMPLQAGWSQEMNINRGQQGDHQSNKSNKKVWSSFPNPEGQRPRFGRKKLSLTHHLYFLK